MVDGHIRFGMGAVKNVGSGAVEEIVREREENGNFKGFIEFCQRVDLKQVNKRVIESLIKVGAFDECESYNRRTLLDNLELIVNFAQKRQEEKLLGQTSLFGGESDSFDDDIQVDESEPMDEKEKLSFESELMGIYVSGHPLDRFNDVIEQLSSMPIGNIQDISGNDKRDMILSGIICDKKNIITKKGDKMCFANLEDLSGKIECIVFPKVFSEYEHLLNGDEPLVVTG